MRLPFSCVCVPSHLPGRALTWLFLLLFCLGSDTPADEPSFQAVNQTFPQLRNGSLAWADFDNDGDLDLLATGDRFGQIGTSISWVLRNDSGSFVNSGISLPAYRSSSADWGDFDNDGFADLALSGLSDYEVAGTRIFRNRGGTNLVLFKLVADVFYGEVVWADFNLDGRLDLVATGNKPDGYPGTARVWRNVGGTNFEPLPPFAPSPASISTYFLSSADSADVDHDGAPDLLINAYTGDLSSGLHLYRNGRTNLAAAGLAIPGFNLLPRFFDADNDGFADVVTPNHPQGVTMIYRTATNGDFQLFTTLSSLGTTATGDVNNDGLNDVLVTGYRITGGDIVPDVTRLYLNPGQGRWLERTNLVVNLSSSIAAWGDYDNDGRLDLIIHGQSGSNFTTYQMRLYRNTTPVTNHPPAAPSQLRHSGEDGITWLAWAPATDSEQSGGLTYNVRVGSRPGAADIVNPMSSPEGYRRVVKRGNADGRTFFGLRGLSPGRDYYWSVQAVDNSFAGSPFSAEQTFRVSAAPELTAPATAVLPEDGAKVIRVTVADPDSATEVINLTAYATNPNLLPGESVRVQRVGGEWQVELTPVRDGFGQSDLVLRATDETDMSTTARLAVEVSPVNDPPRAIASTVTTSEDTAVLIELLGNDPDLQPLSFSITRQPRFGKLRGSGSVLVYEPETNYFGQDQFEFTVSDREVVASPAKVSIAVTPVADRAELSFTASPSADGGLEVRLQGEPRQIYDLESSNDLATWRTLLQLQSPTGELWFYDGLHESARFFRLRSRP